MTPREEQWLAEYRLREAENRIKGLRRALCLWGALAVVWLALLLSEPDNRFTFTDSLLLMMILFNVRNTIRGIVRNKRIVSRARSTKSQRDPTE